MDGFEKTYVSWLEVEKACKEFADEILRHRYKFEYIIAVGKGGLIPATIIANRIKCNVLNLGLNSYTNNNLKSEIEVYQHLDLKIDKDDYFNVLVVDDINDSGDTFTFVENYILNISPTIYLHFWSIFRRNTSKFGSPKIDYSDYALDEVEIAQQAIDVNNNKWIIMPWE
jgi:hypoxanthine phosphoribosyltransferase